MDLVSSAKKVKKKRSVKKPTINMIKCNKCSKVFKDRGSLNKHQAVHSTELPYECTICNYAGKRQQYLRRHLKVKHGGNKDYACDVCGMTFYFGSKLKDHMRVHTGEKPYQCGECGKSFNASYSLNTHKLIHTGDKPYRCVYCAYACRDSSTLRKHQARHTGTEKIYQCKMCHVTCKSKSLLKLHVAEKHLEVDVRRFECNVCGKRFKIKNNLVTHIQAVHDRSRTAKCEVCGLLLTNRGNLSSHMRTHVEGKPYFCTVELCDRTFKNTSSLRKHTLSHYPEKHLACEICRKRFLKKADIERHLNTHKAKVKRVQCDYCGVRFLNTKYLTNHIVRKHSRTEKKYICDACNFITTNKPSLVMHIKGRHKRMFLTKCKMCEKRFLRATYLQRHYWKVHGLEYEIPKRQKKKPKKTNILVKDEPLEFDDGSYYKDLMKEEPMDEEDMLLSNLAAANQLDEVPEEVFEELIDLKEKPERIVRQKLDHRRKDSHKYARDEDAEAQIKRKVRELLEETRQKKSAMTLERTRRKYNRLMKRAVQKSSIKKQQKIQYYNNNKRIDKTNIVCHANLAIDKKQTKEGYSNTSIKKQDELLVEHFSIDHEAELNDQDIDKTVEVTIDTDPTRKDQSSKEIYTTVLNKAINKNVLLHENATDQDTILNKDHEIVDDDVNHGRFRTVLNDLSNEELSAEDTIDDGDKEAINDKNEGRQTVERNDQDEKEVKGRNRKLKLNIHQCYVCFKLFETKDNLIEHCKVHFDVSNVQTWKKCPLCKFTTNLSVTKHLKNVHDIDIKLPYATFKDDNNDILKSKYYYDVGDEIINKVEIIPSVKNLNRLEYKKIDKANRKNKDKGISKTKLVKKGKEWIVVKEKVKIKDCLLPKLDETDNLKVTGGYIEHMKELYRVAKKKGVKMLFPCDSCDKVCLTLSALKLHGRRHAVNPKPFKPKVWKHKVNVQTNESNEANQKTNKAAIKTIIDKNDLPKLDRRTKKAQNELYKEANRESKPKPIVNKHRCKKELKEFYERNIKGGDIEFWQFLKIYNKMGRENINDFSDLQNTTVFGIHSDVPEDSNVEEKEVSDKNVARRRDDVNNKNTRKLLLRNARLSKKEFEKKRNEIKKKLREKIAKRKSMTNKA